MEIHRLLKPHGSLYLHIDHTAHAYSKLLLDAVFGRENFRNEVVWKRTSAHNSANRFGPVHDTLLFYSKSDQYTWNETLQDYDQSYVDSFYRYTDSDDRRYTVGDLTGAGIRHGESGKPWRNHNPTAKGRHWALPRSFPGSDDLPKSIPEALDFLDSIGRIHWPKRGGRVPRFMRYLDDMEGMVAQDVITDIRPVTSRSKERMGYPTQKPLALYERLISASTNPGELVLDPFCGCATTPIAAERLRRRWVGIDIWEGAITQVRQRIEDNRQLLADPNAHVHYEKNPPVRTDSNDVAAPSLRLQLQRPTEQWQRIPHRSLVNILAVAQSTKDGITCAGCGRILEIEFMELDHITPKSDRGTNDITNRILLCRPCNGKKRDNLTLRGLLRENEKTGWMRNVDMATQARNTTEKIASWVRDSYSSDVCQELLDADTAERRGSMTLELRHIIYTL